MRFLLSLLLNFAVPAAAAELTLAIEPRWNSAAVEIPSAPLANTHGQPVRLTRLSALVSGVALARADGGVVRLDGQFGLIDAESEKLTMAFHGVPDGEYVGLEFQLGVPAALNHADVGQWPAAHPLNPLVNGLHWSWQGGYVFLAVEGHWQPAAGGEHGFSYHLATDARLTTMRFRADFVVQGPTTVKLAFDLGRVLSGQSLAVNDGTESTHSAANDERAARLAAAVERAWFFLDAKANGAEGRSAENEGSPNARVRTVEGTTPLAFTVPAGFPQPALPSDNSLTVEGVALGERLFRDVRLSGNGRQSCASCHAPERAFSDAVARSVGAEGKPGRRNAMPLFNLAWNPAFAWDGSKPRVRDQAQAAMTNPIEMHGIPAAVVTALERDGTMTQGFAAAFGEDSVTVERIGLALEQYLLTVVSADSKFDRALRGGEALTADEQRGFDLFLTEYDPSRGRRGADCFHCHGGALFSDGGFKDNGLDLAPKDPGRSAVTGKTGDLGRFKTPSLRNVAITGPYMHDGRFVTLEAVIAHYDHGVRRSANLDPNIAKHPDEGLQLPEADQRALVAFLKTLTDERFSSGDYSSPSQ